MYLLWGLIAALCAIAIQSTAIFYLLSKLRKIKDRPPTYEANELLMDLLAGRSLIKVERISPENVLLRTAGRS